MANDYGYFGSGSTGYAHYKQASTATLAAVSVAAVVAADLRSGIMATITAVEIIPAALF